MSEIVRDSQDVKRDLEFLEDKTWFSLILEWLIAHRPVILNSIISRWKLRT